MKQQQLLETNVSIKCRSQGCTNMDPKQDRDFFAEIVGTVPYTVHGLFSFEQGITVASCLSLKCK